MTGVVEAFRSFGEAGQAGATGVTTRGWKRGSSVEAVDDDIDITPGVRARGTLLPVDMADICQGHGLAESFSRWWGGGGWRRRGLVPKVVLCDLVSAQVSRE